MITAAIVPVHDEQELLPSCLEALDVAAPDLVVIVLDACADRSAVIARSWCRNRDAFALPIDAHNVGIARAHGVRAALEACGADPASLWLANTDADSRVPPHWLREQLAAEADIFAGTIEISDWNDGGGLADKFRAFYRQHEHVHGANLGVRADAYLAAGGFPPIATGEDHALWNALARSRRVFSRAAPVVTSSRRRGRAPAGFANFLVEFAA